eukprot:2520983-Pyramimonas_sp.AAC.1
MAVVRGLRAELVIARAPLVGDRHADDAGTTIALFSPSAYEQGRPGRGTRHPNHCRSGCQRVPAAGHTGGTA